MVFQTFQMLFSIINRYELENSNKLVLLKNQVKAPKIEDKLGKQKFLEEVEKVFELVLKTIKDVSVDVTKAMMVES